MRTRRLNLPVVKFIYPVCFLMLLGTGACNNEDKNEKSREEKEVVLDSLQTANSIISEDSALIFRNQGPLWIEQSLENEAVNWKKFRLTEFWAADSLLKTAFNESPEFYKDYNTVLRWSPDSSFVLDIGSYGSILVKNKNGGAQVRSGEPDTEVSVIFPKTNVRERLMFMGPSSQIINAHWLDTAEVAILGSFDETGSHHPDTLLWIVDVKENFFRKYKYSGD